MDVIEGSELQVADAVYAYQLDGKGGRNADRAG